MTKALFADTELNATHNLAAINSINWARILAQIIYYFHAYFSLAAQPSFSSSSQIRFVVPSGNFGDILAGFFAKKMGLPAAKLVIATNENDILDRFMKTGTYEKQSAADSAPSDATTGIPSDGARAHAAGVRETLSPAMDILVSSNFERLLYLQLVGTTPGSLSEKRTTAALEVGTWLAALKSKGGFTVPQSLLSACQEDFESEKVSDPQTLATIKTFHAPPIPTMESYVLDPHSAVGITASLRSMSRTGTKDVHTISLATAHPAKFAGAVKMALEGVEAFDFEKNVLPKEFVGLEAREKRVRLVAASEGVEGMRRLIREEVEAEGRA